MSPHQDQRPREPEATKGEDAVPPQSAEDGDAANMADYWRFVAEQRMRWAGVRAVGEEIARLMDAVESGPLPEETEAVWCRSRLQTAFELLRDGHMGPPEHPPTAEQVQHALNNGSSDLTHRLWRCFRVLDAMSRDRVKDMPHFERFASREKYSSRRPRFELGLVFLQTVPMERFPTAFQCVLNCSMCFEEWHDTHFSGMMRLRYRSAFLQKMARLPDEKEMDLTLLTELEQRMCALLKHTARDRRMAHILVHDGSPPPLPWRS